MTYVYIDNGITYNGWGVYGVFKLAIKPKPFKDDPEYVSVNMEDMIIGNGPGWDDNTVIDTEWLKRACDLINKYGLEGDI